MSIAVVFPGQGSQSVGMLSEHNKNSVIVKDTFDEASEVLAYDLWNIVSAGPEEKLNRTEFTQPAVLAADITLMRLLLTKSDIKPSIFAGHSLGEYAALVASNAISFKDAIKVVAKRGHLMQNAVPAGEGAMAAILNLQDDEVIKLCEQVSSDSNAVVEAVNFNSPGQVVIAGSTNAVDKAIEYAKEAGAKRAIKLPVSVPSHSSLMKTAADELLDILKSIEIKKPDTPVIHNVDAKNHEEPEKIRESLSSQLYNPVRWSQSIQLISEKVNIIVECGPGKVLSGLTRRINKDVKTFSVETPQSMQSYLDSI